MNGRNFLHYIKYSLGLEKIVTQTSINEQYALKKHVKNAKLIVEIGVFEGLNTREFALNSPQDAVIYAIDPFNKGVFGFSYGKEIAKKEWKKHKILKKIHIVEGLSWDVQKLISQVDFMFIDGDHSFEGVKKDFDIYSEKVTPNGIIAFHDARLFDNGWTSKDWGPVRLVDEVIRKSAKWKIIEEVDSLVVIKKMS